MSSIVTGVDVPLSQMPAGMAFDGVGSGGSGLGDFGSALLGGLGKGLLGSLGGSSSSSSDYGRSATPYGDRTKELLGVMLAQAIDAFAKPKSTI